LLGTSVAILAPTNVAPPDMDAELRSDALLPIVAGTCGDSSGEVARMDLASREAKSQRRRKRAGSYYCRRNQ